MSGHEEEEPDQIYNLLCPGPVNMTFDSLHEMSKAMIGHREEEMHKIISETRSAILQRAFPDGVNPDYDAVIITGSGSASVECMVGSFVRSLDPALEHSIMMISNGSFGERWIDMIACHCTNFVPYRTGWGVALSVDHIVEKARQLGVKGVFMVHHETSVGIVNEFSDLAERLQANNIDLLIDSVSAFGIERVNMNNVSMLAVSSNKALCGPPGLAFVIGRKSVFEACHTGASFYLHLKKHYQFMQSLETPFTPAIPLIRGVQVALQQYLADPIRFQANVDRRMARVLQILNGLGVRLIHALPQKFRSRWLITAYYPPAVVPNPDAFHETLRKDGFIVYRGKGYLSGAAFQTAVIGEITDEILDRFQAALEKACRPSGVPAPASPMPALLLLAGDGSRLLDSMPASNRYPHKAMAELGDETIVERLLRQLQSLRGEGLVGEIHAVVGSHAAELSDYMMKVEPRLVIHTNAAWATTKTSGSARIGLDALLQAGHTRALVCDGDIVCHTDILRRAAAYPKPCVAITRPSVIGVVKPREEAVKAAFDRVSCVLHKTGKDVDGVGEALGVYHVDIAPTVAASKEIGDDVFFDDVISVMASGSPIRALDITGLYCTEVDDAEDLAVARRIVKEKVGLRE